MLLVLRRVIVERRSFAYLSTISERTRPLACNSPLVVTSHLRTEATSCANVLVRAHLQGARVKDLIVVGVEEKVPHARTPLIPRSHTLKGIVESNGNVGVFQVSPTIHVELANGVHVERRAKRFVQELDGGDAGVASEVIAQLVESLDGNFHGVALGPLRSALELTGVVETVLGSRSAVEIEHHFDAVVLSPANCLSHVVVCAVHERSTLASNDGPVTNWQTNEVESNGGDLLEVVFGDPCVPVVSKAV
jgi:hypothetical protein